MNYLSMVHLAAPSSPEEVEVRPTFALAGLPGCAGSGGSRDGRGGLLLRRAPEESSRSKEVEPLEARRRFGRAVLAAVGPRRAVTNGALD